MAVAVLAARGSVPGEHGVGRSYPSPFSLSVLGACQQADTGRSTMSSHSWVGSRAQSELTSNVGRLDP